MEEMHINWAAFAVAVVAQMVVGFIWFHPAVMGTKWAKVQGMDPAGMKPANPGMTYGMTILLTLFFTMFLFINVTGPGQDTAPDGHSYVTFQHGLAHAVVLTFLILIPIFGTLAMYERKGWNWFLIQTGYWFLRMAVGFGILSAWR